MPQLEGNDQNFRDMLFLLQKHEAEFLLIGAHALGVHDLPRATGDIDIWVRADEQNAGRIWAALVEFGAPLATVTADDFAQPGTGLHIGLPPGRIDILTKVSGLTFDAAWQNRVEGKRVVSPEGLDQLDEFGEMPIPKADPNAAPVVPGRCQDMPPTIGSS